MLGLGSKKSHDAIPLLYTEFLLTEEALLPRSMVSILVVTYVMLHNWIRTM